MEKEFQTSFIPKKPLAEARVPRKRPIGVFVLLATILFFTSLITGIGVYFYKASLLRQVESMSVSLEKAKAAFEPSLIEDFQILDRRINSANEVLSKHLIVSPIFETLQELTLKSIRFTSFDFLRNGDQIINVTIKGLSKDYDSIAIQSDLFGQNKYIKNPIFSNLNLDLKGNISFDFTFSVDQEFLLYQRASNS